MINSEPIVDGERFVRMCMTHKRPLGGLEGLECPGGIKGRGKHVCVDWVVVDRGRRPAHDQARVLDECDIDNGHVQEVQRPLERPPAARAELEEGMPQEDPRPGQRRGACFLDRVYLVHPDDEKLTLILRLECRPAWPGSSRYRVTWSMGRVGDKAKSHGTSAATAMQDVAVKEFRAAVDAALKAEWRKASFINVGGATLHLKPVPGPRP